MWPLKTLLLQVRQEINNRNCRVRAAKTLTEERSVTGWRLPSKPGAPASPEGVTVILFPCHVPKATCTLSHPRVQRPEKREVIISTPGHPHAREEQRLYSDLQGQNYKHRPTASGDSKSGHPQISRFGAQFGERGCNHTTIHNQTSTHSYTGFYTSAPTPLTPSTLTH